MKRSQLTLAGQIGKAPVESHEEIMALGELSREFAGTFDTWTPAELPADVVTLGSGEPLSEMIGEDMFAVYPVEP